MKTVCLVRCPSAFLIDERAFPPLGLMAVGAGLKRDGHHVVIYDGELEQLPLDYDYYGFGPTAPEYPHAIDCLHRIKDANPSSRVVIGGPHVTLSRDRGEFDCMVIGDGEFAAHEAFFSDVHEVIAADLPLDEYPIPDRSLVDIHAYRFQLHDKLATTIMGSRGCPFQCGFCCKNHNRVRLNSAERMIEEIEILHNQFGYDALAFPEDIFILNRERTEQVCGHLKRRGIVWRCLVRADLVVKYGLGFLDMMANSGCIGVGVGVESGSDEILRNINKGETAATMERAIGMLKQAGIFTKGFFILGLPGESEDTIQQTEAFLDRTQLDDIDCKIFAPYPGSPIFDNQGAYDVHWDAIPLEYSFYKGRPGDYYGNVRTSQLTSAQIVEAWKRLEQTYKDWDRSIEGAMCDDIRKESR